MTVGRFLAWESAIERLHIFFGGMALGALFQYLTIRTWVFILLAYLVCAWRLGREHSRLEREEAAERAGR